MVGQQASEYGSGAMMEVGRACKGGANSQDNREASVAIKNVGADRVKTRGGARATTEATQPTTTSLSKTNTVSASVSKWVAPGVAAMARRGYLSRSSIKEIGDEPHPLSCRGSSAFVMNLGW